MKAAILRELGQPPRCGEFAEPAAQAGEVLVHVRAASMKPVDKQMASGAHFASPRVLPAVCGVDGLGTLDNGKRVFFGGPRRPFGAMAERTVAPEAFCFAVPDTLDDATAAALPNPGVSAFLALAQSGKLAKGESVLILGATGITGTLALQMARLLGASRVAGAGRDKESLEKLRALGAEATIQFEQSDADLKADFAREWGETGFQVVLDYVWGRPTEVLLAAITQNEFAPAGAETRLIQVGESAAPAISLPAAVLRSRALTIRGTAGIPPRDVLTLAMQQVLEWGAKGVLRIETEQVPLAEVEQAWQRNSRKRLVLVP